MIRYVPGDVELIKFWSFIVLTPSFVSCKKSSLRCLLLTGFLDWTSKGKRPTTMANKQTPLKIRLRNEISLLFLLFLISFHFIKQRSDVQKLNGFYDLLHRPNINFIAVWYAFVYFGWTILGWSTNCRQTIRLVPFFTKSKI